MSLSSKVTKIQQAQSGELIVMFEQDCEEKLVVSEKVLVAIGRQPNTESLQLENTSIVMNDNQKGIKVDSCMKTNIDNIYAIGDVTNIIQLAHVASHQGIVAVDNILNKETAMNYNAVPNVIFTFPEIASVCKTEAELKLEKVEYNVGKFNYVSSGKAKAMGETTGFIKVIKDAQSNKLLGASIIGAQASNLISTLAVAIQDNLSDEDILNTIFAHPTLTEIIHEATFDLTLGALHQ